MADGELKSIFKDFIVQFPLAGAAVWIAHVFMKKHEQVVEKLVSTFEAEIKTCDERFKYVLEEVMKIKDTGSPRK